MQPGRLAAEAPLSRGLTAAREIGRQLLAAALVLAGASLFIYAAARMAPGGEAPTVSVVGAGGSRSLSEPQAPVQGYLAWVAHALGGDFGTSTALQQGRPVAELLWPAAGRSLGLAAAGLGAGAVLALGLALARHRGVGGGSLVVADAGLQLISTVPVFLLVYGAAVGANGAAAWGAQAGWWALPGWFPFPGRDHWVVWAGGVTILAVGDGFLADLRHRIRGDVADIAGEDYLVGARLLGLPVWATVARALAPRLVGHLAARASLALGSLVVLESALGWPGLGNLAWRAAAARDLPVLLAVALLLAVVVRCGAVAEQVVWTVADPRRRGGR